MSTLSILEVAKSTWVLGTQIRNPVRPTISRLSLRAALKLQEKLGVRYS